MSCKVPACNTNCCSLNTSYTLIAFMCLFMLILHFLIFDSYLFILSCILCDVISQIQILIMKFIIFTSSKLCCCEITAVHTPLLSVVISKKCSPLSSLISHTSSSVHHYWNKQIYQLQFKLHFFDMKYSKQAQKPLLKPQRFWPWLSLSRMLMGLGPATACIVLFCHVLLMWPISLPQQCFMCWLAHVMEM